MPRLGEESRDLEAIRAINAARYAQPRGGSRTGRFPMPFSTYVYRNELTVKAYRPRKLYVNMGGPLAKYSHMTRFGWRAYGKDGKLRLTCLRFLCGGTTTNGTVSDEPTMPVCVKCRVVLVGYEAASEALDAMT